MLLREVITVYCENRKEHRYTVWAECRDFIYKNSVRTSQETHYVSATKTNRIMLFREVITVYCIMRNTNKYTVCAECRQKKDKVVPVLN
jgi:hypothetical protein